VAAPLRRLAQVVLAQQILEALSYVLLKQSLNTKTE
jgi:hypothetical protein